MTKAILLLSGGLDSTLAGKMLVEMGVEVRAVSFTSPFCNCTPSGLGCSAASLAAKQIGIEVEHIACKEEYLEVVKHPRFGRGSGVNACIDCRIHMFKIAKRLLGQWGADFIITGETLGQRPMSQRRTAMETIEKEAGLEGLILRPLSAKLFPPTRAEEAGIIDREQLLDIQGRSRKPQMALAEKLGVEDYLCPAGGCLLTEKEYAARFLDLLTHRPDFGVREARQLKWGRHFRLPEGGKVIVGRDEKENELLTKSAVNNEVILQPETVSGPTVLLQERCDQVGLETAARMLAAHSKHRDEPIAVEVLREGAEPALLAEVIALPREEFEPWRIAPRRKAQTTTA
ncbi:MAG: hypothetical protein ACYTGH_01955 [Planctomycetota bacterium]|jgi:tRNA U34 2-thiouridine synthase MnmA/TrmU